jgi:hypothetical protein
MELLHTDRYGISANSKRNFIFDSAKRSARAGSARVEPGVPRTSPVHASRKNVALIAYLLEHAC